MTRFKMYTGPNVRAVADAIARIPATTNLLAGTDHVYYDSPHSLREQERLAHHDGASRSCWNYIEGARVIESRVRRVADALYSAWLPLMRREVEGFNAPASISECANNSVIDNDDSVELLASFAITARAQDGRWPALTEQQIERFVAAAVEAERETR